MYDAVIIGAGITGSYIASEMAGRGFHVCVLEKRGHAGNKTSCTGIVSSECFEQFGFGRECVQAEARSARIFAPSGKFIRIERESNQALILDRPLLDRQMADRAVRAGAEFRFSTGANGIRLGSERKSVLLECDDSQYVEARVAVMATGFGAGLKGLPISTSISDFALGAQTDVACVGLDEVEVYADADIAPGYFAWLVPIGKGKAKAGLLCKNNPSAHIKKFLDRLEAQGKITAGENKVSYGAVPLKTLSRTYADRLVIVGDAAGQVKSTTGGGIYFGLICSKVAVDCLRSSLEADDLSAKSLSRYQQGWRNLLKQELDVDYWAHRFYQRISNAEIEHIFDIIEQNGIHETLLASPDISFDWHSKVILDAIKHKSLQKALGKLRLRKLFNMFK